MKLGLRGQTEISMRLRQERALIDAGGVVALAAALGVLWRLAAYRSPSK